VHAAVGDAVLAAETEFAAVGERGRGVRATGPYMGDRRPPTKIKWRAGAQATFSSVSGVAAPRGNCLLIH